jgi:hypothetical protein
MLTDLRVTEYSTINNLKNEYEKKKLPRRHPIAK